MYQVGKITQVFGLKGEVKILSSTDYDRFNKGSVIYILKDGDYMPLTIERSRYFKQRHIVKIKGIDDINDCLWLIGLEVYGLKLEDETEDEFHFADLIDKDVYLSDNTLIGKVKSIMVVPQGHILEIEKLDNEKVLIPFVKEYIGPINDDSIIIYPIEGMIWE